MGHATRLPRQLPADAEPRLRRLRRLAWLLDRSVGFGPRARFGLDPLIGLVPGLGDWVGGVLSLYIVYEAIRLGVSWPVVWRMLGNVAVETLVGAVPVAGDVFDFWWQANIRNLQLVDRHYGAQLRPRPLRSVAWLLIAIALTMTALIVAAFAAAVWLLQSLWQLLAS